jgi:F-type H+-transporting ATPase subunit c
MKRWCLAVLVSLGTLFLAVAPILAAEGDAQAAGGGTIPGKIIFFTAAVLVAGLGQAIASGMAALAQGRAVSSAVEGIARQPSAAGKIFQNLILGLALIESLAIYVLVIGLILFFATPFKSYIVD